MFTALGIDDGFQVQSLEMLFIHEMIDADGNLSGKGKCAGELEKNISVVRENLGSLKRRSHSWPSCLENKGSLQWMLQRYARPDGDMHTLLHVRWFSRVEIADMNMLGKPCAEMQLAYLVRLLRLNEFSTRPRSLDVKAVPCSAGSSFVKQATRQRCLYG